MRSKTNNQIYVFSGPVMVRNSLEAEIEAIIHMVSIITQNGPEVKDKTFAICSDSTAALEQVRLGLTMYQPLSGPAGGLSDFSWAQFIIPLYIP